MSLYDRVVAPTLSESEPDPVEEGVAKWARRMRSKSASDATHNKARWRTGFGQAAGEHRKMFGKKEGGHAAAGAWQGKQASHSDWKSRMAAHKAARGVKTKGK